MYVCDRGAKYFGGCGKQKTVNLRCYVRHEPSTKHHGRGIGFRHPIRKGFCSPGHRLRFRQGNHPELRNQELHGEKSTHRKNHFSKVYGN